MSNIDGISGHTHLVALLGNPTSHSLSPAIHNLSFKLLGIDTVYLCFDVNADELAGVMSGLRAMESWDGCNVTMPCKQAIIPHLDRLEGAAELMGAVNVVKKEGDTLVGYNTDGVGFMTNLRKHGVNAKGSRMVLIGPGGAGSAILVQAALDGVASIEVFARDGGPSYHHAGDLAERVCERTECTIELHDLDNEDDLRECIQAADILVNATSVGMGEGCTDSLVQPEFLTPDLVVADVVYHPRETQLICDAKAKGCRVVPGLGMILEQAAAGEAIWYDAAMPVDEIAKSIFE